MSGKKCPKCHRLTLWDRGQTLECSNPECRYKIVIPIDRRREEKGQKCPVCGKYTWVNGECSSCGAKALTEVLMCDPISNLKRKQSR